MLPRQGRRRRRGSSGIIWDHPCITIFGGPVPIDVEVALSATEQAERYPCPWADLIFHEKSKIKRDGVLYVEDGVGVMAVWF